MIIDFGSGKEGKSVKNKKELSGQTERQMILCKGCGAVFEAKLPSCPYCGELNYSGAEDAYMDKLGEIREDMDDLKTLTRQQTKQALRRQTRILIRLAILAAVLVVIGLCAVRVIRGREAAADREEYLWRAEMFPKMDELYDTGDLEGLTELYDQERGKGMPVWSYTHSELCDAMIEMDRLNTYFDREASGKVFETYDLQEILYCELHVISMQYRSGVPEADQEQIASMAETCRTDMIRRFSMTDEEAESFERSVKKNGYPSYKEIEEFVASRQEQKG